MRREGLIVVRCTVERLMKDMGVQGADRGKPQKTAIPDPKRPCPMDKATARSMRLRPIGSEAATSRMRRRGGASSSTSTASPKPRSLIAKRHGAAWRPSNMRSSYGAAQESPPAPGYRRQAPAKAEDRFYVALETHAIAASFDKTTLRKPGATHRNQTGMMAGKPDFKAPKTTKNSETAG